jgi:Pyruvate/2-oxoacid:ferredoxin oxidoreductase delta subunit
VKRDVCVVSGGQGQPPTERPPKERCCDWREVLLGYRPEEAAEAAKRCLAVYTCTFCEVCQLLCPDQCITRDPKSGAIQIDLDYCKGCGLCAYLCPKGAIQMEPEPNKLHVLADQKVEQGCNNSGTGDGKDPSPHNPAR